MVRGRGGYPEEKSPSWSESSACGPAVCGGTSERPRVGGPLLSFLRVGRKVNGAAVYVWVWGRLD